MFHSNFGSVVELVSKESNHLAVIWHVYVGSLIFIKKYYFSKR